MTMYCSLRQPRIPSIRDFPFVSILVQNFGFRGWAASNVESYPTFWQTLQLPSSGWICVDWAFLEAIYRAGSRRPPAACTVYGFALKVATAMSAETLDNFQYSSWLIHESQSFTFVSGFENYGILYSVSAVFLICVYMKEIRQLRLCWVFLRLRFPDPPFPSKSWSCQLWFPSWT
jgi:hypothetical protein